jgi:hypothetical protein
LGIKYIQDCGKFSEDENLGDREDEVSTTQDLKRERLCVQDVERIGTVLDLDNYIIMLQSDEPVKSRRKLFNIADVGGFLRP